MKRACKEKKRFNVKKEAFEKEKVKVKFSKLFWDVYKNEIDDSIWVLSTEEDGNQYLVKYMEDEKTVKIPKKKASLEKKFRRSGCPHCTCPCVNCVNCGEFA